MLVDGLHEAIISEETWQAAQIKLLAQAKKYEHVNKGKDTRTHLLSGIVKCPICGAGMYGNKCIKHKKDGTKYKDFYYYGCKHRTMTRGHKCAYKKQIREELLDDAVAEVIVALVSKPKFASMMQEKINMKVDTSVLDQEIANHEKQLRQFYSIKSKLMEEIDSLDPDDRHYLKRKADLDDRLYRMYDKIEDEESQMIEARAKRQAIEAEKLTGDNQREESIEGQIRECTAYAEKNDITIVKHYIDRAISAKTDNRPQFQQMIKDSDKKLFDIVLVWKLDRFARNRYDSARHCQSH